MDRSFQLRRATPVGSEPPKLRAQKQVLIPMRPFLVMAHLLSVEQFVDDLFTAHLNSQLDCSARPLEVALPTAGENNEWRFLEGLLDPTHFTLRGSEYCAFAVTVDDEGKEKLVNVRLALTPESESTVRWVKELELI